MEGARWIWNNMTSVDTQGASRAGSFGEGLRSWQSCLCPILPWALSKSHWYMGLRDFQKGLPDPTVCELLGRVPTRRALIHPFHRCLLGGCLCLALSRVLGGLGNSSCWGCEVARTDSLVLARKTLRHPCALLFESQPLASKCLHQMKSIHPHPYPEPGEGQFRPCHFQWPLKHLWGGMRSVRKQ